MNPLLEQFLQEARENLGFIDQNLDKIGSDDPELLNAVFRAAHTLKGGSGIVGFEAVKQITHQAEDLLDMLRGGKLAYADSMTEALYDAFDEVMNLIEAAEESEEIVEADPDRLERVVAQLRAQMGREDEAHEAWSVPFTPIEQISSIVDMPLRFLASMNVELPFKIEQLTQEECASQQLYAIVFDVDDSCMVYGNDPVYALSLLGEQVVGAHCCMSENAAKAVLGGFDDPDGLLLRTELTAFVYGVYSDIEDALFNFMDELKIAPLDIATLLCIDQGEAGHRLDLLRELHVTPDATVIAESIAKVLPLIGTQTLQYAQLRRLQTLLPLIRSEDLPRLGGFFQAMQAASVYVYQDDEPQLLERADSQPQELPTAKEEVQKPSVAKTLQGEAMHQGMNAILLQQYRALEVAGSDDAAVARVGAILERMRCFDAQMPEFKGGESMRSWLGEKLGLLQQALPQPTTSEPQIVFEEVPEPEPQNEVSAPPVVIKRPEIQSDEKKNASKNVIGKTVKIEQESIDQLMNIVGELLVAKNSLPYLADNVYAMNADLIKRAIMEKYTFINRLSEQLQDLIMSMRMLPISYVFDRYPKLVREISKNLGKKVRLVMNGGETKLDKNMIEMLADPMIHIMRNSLDHGIETPEVRRKKGKDEEGLVSLNAYAQSDKIIIEILDDGAGINVDRVVQKVLEKGLMSLEQIETLSDKERAELVMLPGLSTAETISEYSGRGVGMDVVRKSIESFGGTIGIATRPNQGTTITLSIPVSLAVTSLLHVTMTGVHYGLPMENVNEIVKIERDQIEYLHNEPFIYIRGEVIPLLFIKSMLDEKALGNKALPIVVLSVKGNLLAVVVNELLGQLDVVQKPLEGVMENHPVFSGTALLGNGQIIMVLDPLGILGIAHQLKREYEQVG